MISSRFAVILGCGLLLTASLDSRVSESRSLQQHERARKVVPSDHSRRDPSLAEMRRELLDVARRRDVTRLAAWLAPQVTQGFESPISREKFLQSLAQTPEYAQADFWCPLRDALERGLYKDGDRSAFAPFFHLSQGEFEMVVTGRDVRVHVTPLLNAPVVATLSYDLVNPGPDDLTYAKSPPSPPIQIEGCSYEWRQIITPSGKHGWLPEKYLHAQLDTYFAFTKIGDKWLLHLIGAGD